MVTALPALQGLVVQAGLAWVTLLAATAVVPPPLPTLACVLAGSPLAVRASREEKGGCE